MNDKRPQGTPQINDVVDINNWISSIYFHATGSYGSQRLEGEIISLVGSHEHKCKRIGNSEFGTSGLPTVDDNITPSYLDHIFKGTA